MISAKEKVRVGICGGGGIIDAHCQAMKRTENVIPVALSSRTMKTAKARAKKNGIKRVFDDHYKIIQSDDVDVVLVATPNYQHYELAMAAIDAGKHLFVEKPLAMNVKEGKKMVAAAKKAGVHLIYAEQLPVAPKFARMIEMAKEGRFGDVYMARQIERHSGPHSPWFFNKKAAGGGALMDLGCHSISVIREIYSGLKIASISAMTNTYLHKKGDVEDFILLRINYEGGQVGVVESNWCHLGGMDSITEIFGTKGNGYSDLMKGAGIVTYGEKSKTSTKAETDGWRFLAADPIYENGYLAQVQALANTVITGAPSPQSGEDGLEILKIIQAAYKSAAMGSKPVSPIK